MRKLVVFNLVSLDGYFAGSDGNIDWHVVDLELDSWAAQTIDQYDTVLLGRITYEMFAGYWPAALADPGTSEDDRVVAKALNDWKKIVVSRTLDKAGWHNTEVLRDIQPERIQQLKSGTGRDIVVYGSGTVVKQLTNLGLVDEYRLMVNPIVLGEGTSMFAGVPKTNLQLRTSKAFTSGNILLTYAPRMGPG